MDKEVYNLVAIIFGSITLFIGLLVFLSRVIKNWNDFWIKWHILREEKEIITVLPCLPSNAILILFYLVIWPIFAIITFLFWLLCQILFFLRPAFENFCFLIKIKERIIRAEKSDFRKRRMNKVRKYTKNNTPFKNDISSFSLDGAILKKVDVSLVTNWPKNLRGVKCIPEDIIKKFNLNIPHW